MLKVQRFACGSEDVTWNNYGNYGRRDRAL